MALLYSDFALIKLRAAFFDLVALQTITRQPQQYPTNRTTRRMPLLCEFAAQHVGALLGQRNGELGHPIAGSTNASKPSTIRMGNHLSFLDPSSRRNRWASPAESFLRPPRQFPLSAESY